MKILLIGLGNVGANLCFLLLNNPSVKEIFLFDVKREILKGKLLDFSHCLGIIKSDLKITVLESLKDCNPDIIVITAGKPRKEGMSRLDLLEENILIFNQILENFKNNAENKIFIIVTNPVDILTYYVHKKLNIDRFKVFGMAGVLDQGRLRFNLAKNLGKNISKVSEPLIIGPHSKDMVPILKDYPDDERIREAIKQTKEAGAKIVSYLKTSAYFAPALAIKTMLEAIIEAREKELICSCVLEGEYGYQDISFGVPVVIGKKGIEKIIELKLTLEQKKELDASLEGIKQGINLLKDKKYI